jgi:hypothetical protein
MPPGDASRRDHDHRGEAGMTRPDIRAAIDDLQNIESNLLTSGQRTLVDEVLGFFYEAFAQAVLSENRIRVDIGVLCGFQRYAEPPLRSNYGLNEVLA